MLNEDKQQFEKFTSLLEKGGFIMLFSERLLLSDLYKKWTEENKVHNNALGVITFLDSLGYLNFQKIKKEILLCEEEES